MASRGSASGVPLRRIAGVELAVHERHPRVAAAVAVEQPHAAGAALAFLDQRLDEGAEEAVDVLFAHHQVERQLHGVALDPRHAVGSALRIQGRGQLAFQLIDRACASPCGPAGTVEHALPIISPRGRRRRLGGGPSPSSYQRTMSGRPRPAGPESRRTRAALSTDLRLGPQPNCLDTGSARDDAVMSITFRLASLRSSGLSSRCRLRAAGRPSAPPPAPPVTAAKAVARDVTEWNEFTGRLEAVHTRGRPSARVGLDCLRPVHRRRDRAAAATCCSRSIRGRSRPKWIACAPTWRAPRPRFARADGGARARAAAVGRERHLHRGTRPPVLVGRRGRGAGLGRRGRAAVRRAEPGVHAR